MNDRECLCICQPLEEWLVLRWQPAERDRESPIICPALTIRLASAPVAATQFGSLHQQKLTINSTCNLSERPLEGDNDS